MSRIKYDFNKEQLNLSLNFSNHPHRDTCVNASAIILTDLENVLLYLKVNIKENQKDDNYRKTFFSGIVDANKLLKGTYGNYIASNLLDAVKKSTDFPLSFPLKKVGA